MAKFQILNSTQRYSSIPLSLVNMMHFNIKPHTPMKQAASTGIGFLSVELSWMTT